MSGVSNVQQALCISIAKICADTAPGAPIPQPVRDTTRKLFPPKQAHSIRQGEMEVIDLSTDSEDDHGPQTPPAADVYDTPSMPHKQAAQEERKKEWTPHPSDASDEQVEQGVLCIQGKEVDGRSQLTSACLKVPSDCATAERSI